MHLYDRHVHNCGHGCACALAGTTKCVQCDIDATADVVRREMIWRERWPADHPHDQGAELPQQHRVTVGG